MELDGFKENENILVFGSTNVTKEGLDSALLRPGRFDREIYIDLPDKEDREEVFKLYLNKLKCDERVLLKESIEKFSKLTVGLTGADIEAICNEAAIFAIRDNKKIIGVKNVEEAIERIINGIEKKGSVITEFEKKVVSYHEAAHAVCSHFLTTQKSDKKKKINDVDIIDVEDEERDEILEISIIRRGGKVGHTRLIPKERKIITLKHVKNIIAQLIAGRVSEKLFFNLISTGPLDDLKRITNLAYSAISTFGFDENIGPLSYEIPGEEKMTVQKPYSEEVSSLIDEKVKTLVDEAYKRAEILLIEKRDIVEKLAKELIENEQVSNKKFLEIVNS